MSPELKLLKEYCQEQIDNHSIYVWGAEGQTEPTVNEAWIRNAEKKNGGTHADDAVAFWQEQHDAGYGPVLRAFDCSGFVSEALKYAGVSTGRMDCDRLYSRTNRITDLKDGCLLFRVSATNPNDRTHVGFYLDGCQYHAKGRKYGVVKEKFSASYWAEYAWWKAMPDDGPEPEPIPVGELHFSHALRNGNRCEDVSKLKDLLIAKGYRSGITRGNQSYGPSTTSLVKRYQADHGLAADGVAGELTIKSLGGHWV